MSLIFLLILLLARSASAFVCGDVNGDNVVNIGDALNVAQFDVALRTCAVRPMAHPDLCDVNHDSACNIIDANAIAQCDIGARSCVFACSAFNPCPAPTTTTTTTLTTTTTGVGTTSTTTIVTTTTTTVTTTSTTLGTSGTVHGVVREGGSMVEQGLGGAADPSGNSVVGGAFQGTTNLGTGPIASNGSDDAFLVKFTPAGGVTWVRTFGGTGSDHVTGVATDSTGNVYATGYFQGTSVDFGCVSKPTSVGGQDIFVVKYSPTNTCLWVVRFGGVNDDNGGGIAIDPSGNVLVAGTFSGTVNFGGGNLVPFSGGRNAFILKLNGSTGVHMWSARLGSGGESFGNGVGSDASGNALVVGNSIGPVLFNGVTSPTQGGTDIFVAKYGAASGTETWFHNPSSTGNDVGLAIAVDTDGKPSITGAFAGPIDFGGGTLTPTNLDPFVVKYDAAGTFVWAKQGAGAGFDNGNGIAVDPSTKDIVVTGYFSATLNWGTTTLSTFGNQDIFLTKLAAANGAEIWSHHYGGPSNDPGQATWTDASRNIFTTGFFVGTATFGTTTLTSAGSGDVFLLNVFP